ncbi:hypothetical protein NL676_001692 [Syzygium grande]|nr:hypothetical protein NL676_001692 [Syzygium grande]
MVHVRACAWAAAKRRGAGLEWRRRRVTTTVEAAEETGRKEVIPWAPKARNLCYPTGKSDAETIRLDLDLARTIKGLVSGSKFQFSRAVLKHYFLSVELNPF